MIDRRRFLCSSGVSVALPMFSSLRVTAQENLLSKPSSNPGTTASGAPLRMAFMCIPNGVQQQHWFPSDEFELGESHEPLRDLKDHFQVISGLDHLNATAGSDGGGDHARANATYLTGMRARKSASDVHVGVSIDQVAARSYGHLTRLPSLELTSDRIRTSGGCDSGYACAYQYNISWSSATTPVAAETNPRLVFERLFGGGAPAERTSNYLLRQASDRSVLDFVAEESRAVRRQLGSYDLRKFDEYTEIVRGMERRLQAAQQFGDPPKTESEVPADEIPIDFANYMDLMYDMLVLAFQTDSTRIGTLMLAHDGSNRTFPSLGIAEGHHYMTHNQHKPEYVEKIVKIDQFYLASFARFLRRMNEVKDVDGESLLHNSMIMYGGAIADGNRHTHENLPVILAGRGGGQIETGRHLRAEKQPMSNLFVSMLNRCGVDVNAFGDSTGQLSELT